MATEVGDSTQPEVNAEVASENAGFDKLAAVEGDLFDRVQAKVNKERLKAFLVEYQQQYPGEISTSGAKADLIGHLRAACSVGRISRERVFALLREYEENGNQTVLYYSPKTAAVVATCCNPGEVGARLFGDDWRQTFPKLPRLSNGWEVVDFRAGLPGKPNDWLLKLYTYQESNVQVRELQDTELVAHGIGLRENEYVVVYERRVTESVCIVRWNNHPKHNLLELRVELSGRLARFEADVNSLWTSLEPVFRRDDDFKAWELGRPLEQMLRECSLHPNLYQLGLAHLVDSGEGGIKYVPYTEHEPLDATPIRLQTITQILDDGGRCSRLATTWLHEESGGALEEKLRTHAGPRRTNELVISAQATARAVDYVTDQLRYFAV